MKSKSIDLRHPFITFAVTYLASFNVIGLHHDDVKYIPSGRLS
jgi:hypothetical protein